MAVLETALTITPTDLWELCRDKDFRHSLNAEWLVYQLRNQIRGMRLKRGWTQTELARRMGVWHSTVNRLENMTVDTMPSIRTLRKVAHVFDVALVVRFQEWGTFLQQILDAQKDGVLIPRSWSETLDELKAQYCPQ